MSVESKLQELGLSLPEMATPAGAYVPGKQTGNLIFVAGQLPLRDGNLICTGKVGSDVTVEEAYKGAKQCALNGLAVLKSVAGSLDSIAQLVRVEGFVASAQGFTDQEGDQRGVGAVRVGVRRGGESREVCGGRQRVAPGGECGGGFDCGSGA